MRLGFQRQCHQCFREGWSLEEGDEDAENLGFSVLFGVSQNGHLIII